MKIGLIGLGKMGHNLALNLHDHGHDVVGFDLMAESRARLEAAGVETAQTLPEMVDELDEPRVVWMMVPSGEATDSTIHQCIEVLGAGDVLIDGGNSFYKDSKRHASECEAAGIRFLDVGTSGGMSGARGGACLMVGGSEDAYRVVEDVLEDVTCEDGLVYCGPAGSGHFMKMVHNGVEYGMMEAIGEGFAILRESEYDYDLAAVAKNWNHGSVVRSWLMELAEEQLRAHPDLADFKGVVAASGEATWTVQAALEEEVPAPVIAQALFERNASQFGDENFSNKMVAALRNGFGGHAYMSR